MPRKSNLSVYFVGRSTVDKVGIKRRKMNTNLKEMRRKKGRIALRISPNGRKYNFGSLPLPFCGLINK